MEFLRLLFCGMQSRARKFPTGNLLGWDGKEFKCMAIRFFCLFLGLEIGSSLFYFSFIRVNFGSEPQVGSAGREAERIPCWIHLCQGGFKPFFVLFFHVKPRV